MRIKFFRTFPLLLLCLLWFTCASAQDNELTDQQRDRVEKAFKLANSLMDEKKFADALTHYKEALAIIPGNPALLFNGGLAAYSSNDFATATDLWKRLKTIDPFDWQVRTKLIQAYQAQEKTTERDAERTELLGMWKAGTPDELKQQKEFCREQLRVNGRKVMVFEHFELTGERALRYVFSVLDDTEKAEDFRISLGSYEMDNAIWRETTKPPPKPGERLFHLDGYFKGSHATYGFFTPEPSYEQIRARVIQILQGKIKPISSSTFQAPALKPTPE